jgi:hypothetical protein
MCWEISKRKDTQQTGLAASTIANDDEFSANDVLLVCVGHDFDVVSVRSQ